MNSGSANVVDDAPFRHFHGPAPIGNRPAGTANGIRGGAVSHISLISCSIPNVWMGAERTGGIGVSAGRAAGIGAGSVAALASGAVPNCGYAAVA